MGASALPFRRLDPNAPSSVKQVLTLANKYGMENLRNRIVVHVEVDWPQMLWQWDRLEAEISAMEETWYEEHGCALSCEDLDDQLPEPASAIQLTWECHIPSILPAAFYHLSHLSIHNNWCTPRIVKNHKASEASCEGLFHGNHTADWQLLSSERLYMPIEGKGKACFDPQRALQCNSNVQSPTLN
jgi:hypothetical protein